MNTCVSDYQSISGKTTDRSPDRLAHIMVFFYIISFFIIYDNPVLAFIPNALTFFLCVLFLVQALKKGMKIPYQVFYPIIFLLFSISSVLWSVSTDSALTLFLRTTIACIAGLIIWFELKMGMPYQIVLNASMIGAGLLVLFQLISNPNLQTQVSYSSIIGNQNAFAMILSESAFLSFCSPVLRNKKFYILLSIGLLVFSFLFTGSRKVLLVLLCLLLFPIFWALRKHHRLLFYSILILLIIFGTAIYIYADEILQIPIFREIEVTRRLALYLNLDNTVRQEMTEEAIDIWLHHPIIGVGMAQFAEVSRFGVYSHNNYVETLANLGIIGLFLYYSFFFTIIKKNFSLIQRQQAKQFSTILLVLILVLDLGMVSYMDRMTWVLLGTSAYLADL